MDLLDFLIDNILLYVTCDTTYIDLILTCSLGLFCLFRNHNGRGRVGACQVCSTTLLGFIYIYTIDISGNVPNNGLQGVHGTLLKASSRLQSLITAIWLEYRENIKQLSWLRCKHIKMHMIHFYL
jgi:hypothetical protein